MSRVRLIAIDLDGTLLTSDRTIHPRSAEAVRRAAEAGVCIVLASGRVVSTMRPFASELGLSPPYVSCNGAYVLDSQGDEVHHMGVRPEVSHRVIDYADQCGCHLNVYCRDDVFFLRDSGWGDVYRGRAKLLSPTIRSAEVLKSLEPTKMMIVDDPESLQIHQEKLVRSLDPQSVETVISEAEYLEFLAPGVSKATGLEALASRMGIRREETAAIGDYHNDVAMLHWAGVSGTVANAVEEAKTAADRVWGSNNEGGVADFIDSIVQNGRE